MLVHDPGAPDPAAAATTLQAEFPDFRIWEEVMPTDDGSPQTRYVAQRRRIDIRPHTLVSSDPSEIRAILNSYRLK